jgi:ADP-ribose pyrophosphatase YjhB (NUDIX family)
MRQRRRIAAYGYCRDGTGRVLLVRGSATGDAVGVWNLPGGGLRHGEHPRDAVVREFVEETGLTVRGVTLRDVVSDLTAFPERDEVIHHDRVLYDVVTGSGGELRHEADGSSDRAEWVPPGELAGLPLLPFAARLLGAPLPSAHSGSRSGAGRAGTRVNGVVPAARAVRDPAATRHQRFAAYGLTTDPAGRFLLTRIAPGYPGAGTWHLPGGGTHFGEQPDTGLLRELVEETDQTGRVTGLLDVTHYHNPRAHGPEGRPMDWHTVRALYRVIVDVPGVPSVIEASGGSTAEARWLTRGDLPKVPLNEFARRAIAGLAR